MKKIYLIFTIIFVFLMVSVYFVFWPKVRLELAAEAVGGFPYQVGLVPGTQRFECMYTKPLPVACTGGSKLCPGAFHKGCETYAAVEGTMAGGSGNSALFLKTTLGAAGYKPGDPIIAAGIAPLDMDQGVIATPAACTGSACTTINDKNIFQKYYEIAKYAIAKIKD